MDNEQRDWSREYAVIPTNQSDSESGNRNPAERRERTHMNETDFSSSQAVTSK